MLSSSSGGGGGISLLQNLPDSAVSEGETELMQEGHEGEKKNGEFRIMTSLRSPIAGDLASPQHYIASTQALVASPQSHLTIKVSLKK